MKPQKVICSAARSTPARSIHLLARSAATIDCDCGRTAHRGFE
jgi:hypothetical protein